MKKLCQAILTCMTLVGASAATPALADEYTAYPLNTPCYPFQRSYYSGRAAIIPPYDHVFPVRIYTTPPQQPYYNVPPYAVIAPY